MQWPVLSLQITIKAKIQPPKPLISKSPSIKRIALAVWQANTIVLSQAKMLFY